MASCKGQEIATRSGGNDALRLRPATLWGRRGIRERGRREGRPHAQVARDAVRDRRPRQPGDRPLQKVRHGRDRKSTRLNSSHANISYAVFCLKKKKV